MSNPLGAYRPGDREVCLPTVRTEPLRKTRDLRSAMAETLRDYVNTLRFGLPATRELKGFAEVYDSWARFEDRALSAEGKLPAATVLPDRTSYTDSSLTPRFIPGTWFQNHPEDQPHKRYGLFAVSEAETSFVVLCRAKSQAQRKAIVSAFEDAFVEPGTPGDSKPVRYGKLLTMGSYYERAVRFTLQDQQILDSSTSPQENRWLVQFELLGHAQQVVVRQIPEMRVRVHTAVDGLTEGC